MAEVVRLLCDKCGSEEGVGAYRLSTPETGLNRAVALDLCPECAAPIEDLESLGKTVARPRRRSAPIRQGRGGETLRAKIHTQAELDEMEREESVRHDETPPKP